MHSVCVLARHQECIQARNESNEVGVEAGVEAGFAPAEWIKGTLTIPNQVYMKKLIVSIKT